MIDRKFFFDQARTTLFEGKLRAAQVVGCEAILDRWEEYHARGDDRWLAYMLATCHHETDRKFQPIREYGRGKGKKYGIPDPENGHVYYGRGFSQISWKDNYRRLGKALKVDLVNNPDLALDLEVSVGILFVGMIRGMFTGRSLVHYFSDGKDDWKGARRIVNGTDKASLIAEYGKRYYAAVSYRG